MKLPKRIGLRLLSCISAALLLGSTAQLVPSFAAEQTTTVANPVIYADVPDDDIIRVGNTYYMVSTTMFFNPGAPIMKSTDLVSWEICNYVYDTYANGDVQNLANGKHDYAHGSWAASLRYHEGTFYVFFGSYGSGKSYIYKTNDIENGTWTRSEINGMYHDASMLIGDNGRNYLVYGGGGEIKIKELNAGMTGFQGGGADQTLLKTGLNNLAGEGSHIQKIGDYYYIFLIAWPSGSGRIELCYRSKSVLGPYEGKTVLNSGLGTYGAGVAQGGIVDTPSGDWYALLFQDHGSIGRVPVLVPVQWQDNWPIMGVNGKAPQTLTVQGGYAGTFLAKDDSFSYAENKLKLEWQWNHNPDNTAWSVTEREGYLRLKNNHIAASLLHARNTLTMRTEGPSCSSVIKLDASGMKAGDYAGLSAFQYNYGTVGVYVKDNGSKAVYMGKNSGYNENADVLQSRDRIVAETPMTGDDIYLKVDFVFATVDGNYNVSNNIDKATFAYSYDGKNWTPIGDTLSMTYSLKLFTGYRSGIYSYPTKSTGGHADIDFFEYERGDWNLPVNTDPDENGWYFHSTFEGTKDVWDGRGSASVQTSSKIAYEGNESLYVQGRAAAWNGAYRTLNSNIFVPGKTYSFSANVVNTEGTGSDTFYLKLQYVDAAGETNYATIAESTAAIGDWTQLANTEYTIPADASNLQLYIETVESEDNFYVDDVIGAVAGTIIPGAGGTKVLLGDVNGDGTINVIDLTCAKGGLLTSFSTKQAELAADVDQSGAVTMADLVLLQKFLLGAVDHFV